MTDALYNEILLSLCREPLNKKSLEEFDFRLKHHNPSCGDQLEIFVKLKNGKVSDIGWQGTGCAVSEASASLLTDFVKGKTPVEISKISPKKIIALLGLKDINPARENCAFLPLYALKKIED